MDDSQTGGAGRTPIETRIVSSILTSDHATETSLPQEHLSTPSTPHSTTPHQQKSFQARKGAPAPLQIPNRRNKSSSISIVPQPCHPRNSHHHHRAAASVSHLPTAFSSADSAAEVDTTASDTDFLTALAAQERRVLELREELHKAEQHLLGLKKSWASQEAVRRRNPVQKLSRMRPMSAGDSPRTKARDDDDDDGSSDWMYQEMARRKNVISRNYNGHRRVFSGSRDIRPLKLVSPTTKRLGAPALSDGESGELTAPQERTKPATRMARSSTMPGFGEPIPEESAGDRSPSPYKTGAHHVRKGTQIVSDFREGLWTFFEDLRQATVGEDIQPIEQPRGRVSTKKRSSPKVTRRSSRQEPRPHDDATLIDIGGAFWKDHGIQQKGDGLRTPYKEARHTATKHSASKKYTKSPRAVILRTQNFDGETWDTWDTPEKVSPARSNSVSSASPAQHSSSTGRNGSSRTSSQSSVEVTAAIELGSAPGSEHEYQNDIDSHATQDDTAPWPAFTKRASMLRSSAMQLMDEWERSLNPASSQAQRTRD